MQTNSTNNTSSYIESKNKALSFEAATECMVLLKNDGALPFAPCRLALFGAGSAYTIYGGSGSGEVNVIHAVNVIEGLENAGFTITTKEWINRYDLLWKKEKAAYIKKMRKKLLLSGSGIMTAILSADFRYPDGDIITESDITDSNTDTCIYMISRQSGEGHDRLDESGSFRLTENEISNVKICAGHYKNFVLILNSGASLDLSPLDDISGINAILFMSQPGMESGNALAAIITGRCTPSGKLATTWARHYSDYPFSDEFGPYSKDPAHTLYKEGIYVGYRYFDTFNIEPRYPLGFGMSYTHFSLNIKEVSLHGTDVKIEVNVKNIGDDYSGKEVVQIHVCCPENGLEKEYQRLAAFKKTRLLAPGESEDLDISFPVSYLSCYSEENAETFLEKGYYLLRVGTSSRDTMPAARLYIPEQIILSRHKNACTSDHIIRKLCKNISASDDINNQSVNTAEKWPTPLDNIIAGNQSNNTFEKRSIIQGNMVFKDHTTADIKVLNIDPALFHTEIYNYQTLDSNIATDADKSASFSTAGHTSACTKDLLDSLSVKDMLRFCAGTGLFRIKKGTSVPGAAGHTTNAFLDRGIPNRELCDGPAGLRIQCRSVLAGNGKLKPVDPPISIYEFLPKFITRFMLGDPSKGTLVYKNVTGFPVAAGVAQSWNTELAERIGYAVSTEMSAHGITWWLAPALNIVRNPMCGRNFEYFSEDPLLSGKFAAAITRGVQTINGNYVTLKHFAANNQESNRLYVSSDIDERTLREIYLKGFEIAVKESSPKAVMSAYNKINGIYCANNKELCTDILRCEWGFSGIVMTDWLSTGKGRADDAGCLLSGVDLIMPGGKKVIRNLKKAYRKGLLTEENICISCNRILKQIISI